MPHWNVSTFKPKKGREKNKDGKHCTTEQRTGKLKNETHEHVSALLFFFGPFMVCIETAKYKCCKTSF